MIEMIKNEWEKSYFPFLVIMTASADEQMCKDFGFNLILYYDQEKMQRIIIDKLKNDTDIYFSNKIYRNPSLLPCLELKILSKEFLSTLNLKRSNFDNWVDRCFCKNCEPQLI